jgi:DNA-binding CsgD family transcriptional regulator
VHFTPRQEQILALAATGHLDKEIAIALEIALPTVRTHLERLYREYGLHNRTEAVTVWLSKNNLPT